MKNNNNTKKENSKAKKKNIKMIVKGEKGTNNIEIKIKEQKKTVNPPIISYIVTHEHHNKYGTVYYINKIYTSDKVLFPIPALSVNTLNKSECCQINQYKVSNQFKKLYNAEYNLSAIMGKTEKYIDNSTFTPMLETKPS